ncbi:methylated-DNA--[protein]-cysteine S-methyltransferase [Microbacterium awajiense]|uniref:Methylated-DNA--[protein]-cysteine S-methyltransferase n=1 Tax=Microbacterium awajiense TaxID=415214 RepID=A0ABP7AD65_9MICO
MTSPPLLWRLHPSPIGDILIATVAGRLVTLQPVRDSPHDDLRRLSIALRMPPEPDESDAVANLAARQLDAYFSRSLRTFDVPLDWRLVRGFTRAALQAVCAIPYAETAGYGEVAANAGSPRAARAVGTACATTPFSIVVPVHRVIRSDGSLGEYGGRPEVKRFLLDLEAGTNAGE